MDKNTKGVSDEDKDKEISCNYYNGITQVTIEYSGKNCAVALNTDAECSIFIRCSEMKTTFCDIYDSITEYLAG